MNVLDLLTPWFTLAAILVPLVYAEKWIHSHLYGVGWLLTEKDKSATALYYVLLFPGVFLHEFTQYIMAGALNVKIKRIIQWPEAQKDGTLRLDFVQIQDARWFQAAIIGATPLITGLALVWVISSQVLSLDQVVVAIQAQDSDMFQATLRNLISTPDFFLWLFLIFTISNAMLPTPADRQGWPLLLAAFAGVIGLLILIGVGDVLYEKATGPLAQAVESVTTAFAMVLVVEVPGIIFIGFLEEVLERITKRKFSYERGRRQPATRGAAKRVPGSNLPLPPGMPLPSIYNMNLPIPDPSNPIPRPAVNRQSASPARTPAPPPAAAAGAAAQRTEAAALPTQAIESDRGSRARPMPTAPAVPAESRSRSELSQSARRPDDRTARPAETPRTSAMPGPSTQRPPDDRRAQPLEPARRDAPSPGGQRLGTPDRGTERAAPDAGADRARPDLDRSRRSSRSTPFSAPTPRARPELTSDDRGDMSRRTTPDMPDMRRARPASSQRDRSSDDDPTQRLDQTGRLREPGMSSSSYRARPMETRRPSPFDDDYDDDDLDDDFDDDADDEFDYVDDPDVMQDIPDDDL